MKASLIIRLIDTVMPRLSLVRPQFSTDCPRGKHLDGIGFTYLDQRRGRQILIHVYSTFSSMSDVRQLSNLEAAIVVVEMDMLLTALDVVKWSI